MGKTRKKRTGGFRCVRFGLIAATIVLIMGVCDIAGAFEIPTGTENIGLRWDNTFRYNFGVRTKNPDDAIILNPNFDDGDRNFDKGTVTNRLDILSELDLRVMNDYGVRFSGAFWYDQRYHDPLGNESVGTSNHLVNGVPALGFSNRTKKYYKGPDGELLDAFAYGNVQLGPIPVNIKVGRHTVYWGESLLFGGALNGVSYGQMPIDVAKAFACPGVEVKELFRPLFNISAQAQITNTLSISGQYFLQWEASRLPESGSYLAPADMFMKGGDSIYLPPLYAAVLGRAYVPHGSDREPDGKKNWGVAMQWSPVWLEGKVGLYYRKFADTLPQLHLNATNLAAPEYFSAYAEDIELYGVSFTKQVLGVSVGMEYSYRRNMPLASDPVAVAPLFGTPGAPLEGETLAARGNTQHALINFLGLIKKTPLFGGAQWMLEFTWNHWDKVTSDGVNPLSGQGYFLGRDGYDGIDHVTRDAVGASVSFIPTWYQLFPGMDLSMPINYSRGLSGTSALLLAEAKNAGNASIGFGLDVYQKYNFAISYVTFFGDYDREPTGGVSQYRGLQALLSDRDMVTFTFKFTL